MINFLALLGWSPGNDQELFTREELISSFDLGGISRSPAVFDQDKLLWMNGLYIRQLSPRSSHSVRCRSCSARVCCQSQWMK